MMCLPTGEKISKISLFILTECTNVTDTQTDGWTNAQTPHDGTGRTCIASHGKNGTIQKPGHSIIFAFYSNYGHIYIVSETQRDIGQKSRFFHNPLAIKTPVRGSPLEYCHNVWYGETSSPACCAYLTI